MEAVGKATLPSICVFVVLRQIPVVCHDVEAELVIWRGACSVQRGNSFTEF